MLRKTTGDNSQIGDTYNDCSRNPFATANFDESGSNICLQSENCSESSSAMSDQQDDDMEDFSKSQTAQEVNWKGLNISFPKQINSLIY